MTQVSFNFKVCFENILLQVTKVIILLQDRVSLSGKYDIITSYCY